MGFFIYRFNFFPGFSEFNPLRTNIKRTSKRGGRGLNEILTTKPLNS